MSADSPQAEFEFRSGDQHGSSLALYANRVVHRAGDAMETVPLAHLASVRVAFERDPRTLNWTIVLLFAAGALFAVSGPLQGWAGSLTARAGEHARRESLDAMLQAVFAVLGGIASLLPAVAAALSALAIALGVLYWLGRTRLTLSFAASERVFAVRGRNRLLLEFSEALSERLAARLG